MSIPAYPTYEDSGVDWLGYLPVTWRVVRIKILFEIRKEIVGALGHDVLSITQSGIKVKDIESNDGQLSMDYSKYQIVIPGDFAMNHMDLLTGWVDISQQRGVTSPDYRVFRARQNSKIEPRFYLYLFQMAYVERLFYPFGQGSSQLGRWRLPTDAFNDFSFPLPPKDEQSVIAAFLDLETLKIDGLIQEQRKLIKLLKEKRQATISHAVTKGLDPNAPMKDSGIEWLGQMPAHWKTTSVKRVANIRYGIGEPPEYRSEGIPLIRATNVHAGKIHKQDLVFVNPDDIPEKRIVWLEAGDIIVVRSGAYTGDSAIIPNMAGKLIAGFDMVLRCHSIDADFVQFTLLSAYLLEGQIVLERMRAAQPHLNAEELGACILVMPPFNEQKKIVGFLQSKINEIDALENEAKNAIALLQERRTALISAAVTGKIDVRGMVNDSNDQAAA